MQVWNRFQVHFEKIPNTYVHWRLLSYIYQLSDLPATDFLPRAESSVCCQTCPRAESFPGRSHLYLWTLSRCNCEMPSLFSEEFSFNISRPAIGFHGTGFDLEQAALLPFFINWFSFSTATIKRSTQLVPDWPEPSSFTAWVSLLLGFLIFWWINRRRREWRRRSRHLERGTWGILSGESASEDGDWSSHSVIFSTLQPAWIEFDFFFKYFCISFVEDHSHYIDQINLEYQLVSVLFRTQSQRRNKAG